MRLTNLNSKTLAKIQKMIEANYCGRDELYSAAEFVDDQARERICRRLADYLAANAIELQQIVAASGVDPAGPLGHGGHCSQAFRPGKVESRRGGSVKSRCGV